MEETTRVLVAGHSFVRRLGVHLKSEGRTLDCEEASVAIYGLGGAKIVGKRAFFPLVNQYMCDQKPYDMLFLDLGSNDLNKGVNLQELAQEYFVEIDRLVRSHPMKRVVVCTPIPKTSGKFPHSWDITQRFNLELKRQVAKGPENVRLWSHKGLFKKGGDTLHADGVHLSRKGMERYFHSLRAGVRKHACEQGHLRSW